VAGTKNVYFAAMEIEYDITASVLCECAGSAPSFTKQYKNDSTFYSAKP
jgi:hypothetical protein